jgi:crossover junction endodeoxyribonuclease RusA
MIITLPFPPLHCWPNARSRSHWPSTDAKAKAKRWAYLATRAAAGGFSGDGSSIPVTVHVHAKPRGPLPDGDNVNAACKAYFDGIAEALGVNDRHFVVAAPVFGERVKGGKVVIKIGAQS